MDDIVSIKKIMRDLRKVNTSIFCFASHAFAKFGLSPSQASLIMEISKNGPMTVSSLSERLNMPPSNISGICKRLEKAEFVEKTRDQKDQRIVNISLTQKAKNIAKEAEKAYHELLLQFCNVSSAEDIDIMCKGVERLASLLNKVSIRQEEL